jgi:hypothetical protein
MYRTGSTSVSILTPVMTPAHPSRGKELATTNEPKKMNTQFCHQLMPTVFNSTVFASVHSLDHSQQIESYQTCVDKTEWRARSNPAPARTGASTREFVPPPPDTAAAPHPHRARGGWVAQTGLPETRWALATCHRSERRKPCPPRSGR